MRIPLSLGSVVLSVLLAAACGGADANLPPPPPPPPPPPVPTTVATAEPPIAIADAAPATPPAPTPGLVTGVASPDPAAPLPVVRITAPGKDQVLAKDKAGDFAVKLDVKSWPTATGSSHVHLILDNRPYKPIYDPKAPVKLSELTGGDALSEGPHVLVAFPSRANHESVKTAGALAVVPFWVGAKKGDAVDPKKPMLIYSRPKGEYKGDAASHVLVDFYLANASLAEGKEHVRFAVTGPGIEKELTGTVEKWGTPLYLDNLQNGTFKVKLELLGGDKQPLAGAIWSPTTREIVLNHDAPNDNPHAGHALDTAVDAGAPKAGGAKRDAGAPHAKGTGGGGGKDTGGGGGKGTGGGTGGATPPKK